MTKNHKHSRQKNFSKFLKSLTRSNDDYYKPLNHLKFKDQLTLTKLEVATDVEMMCASIFRHLEEEPNIPSSTYWWIQSKTKDIQTLVQNLKFNNETEATL